jgi:3-dehydroquinate synthase
MKTLHLDLGERSYPIYIGDNLLARADLISPHIAGARVAIVSDEQVPRKYLDTVAGALAAFQPIRIVLPAGEEHKNLETLNRIFTGLLQARCDRKTTLIALGGGRVGDMAGFAAACYQRGVPFIQIPTTLLAQVDSSVGGKTGVNHQLGKNMIGAFYQPRCVIIDTDTLNTLLPNQMSAGIAEVIKYGLIRDPQFFAWLEENMAALRARDPKVLSYAIEQSCRNKAEVVAADEKETGVRALLNLGHTFGHAIETGTGYAWSHGDAVAAGTIMAADLSHRLGWLPLEALRRIEALMKQAGLPVRSPLLAASHFLELMAVDKKARDGKLRLVLLQAIGRAVISDEFSPALLKETLIQRGLTP